MRTVSLPCLPPTRSRVAFLSSYITSRGRGSREGEREVGRETLWPPQRPQMGLISYPRLQDGTTTRREHSGRGSLARPLSGQEISFICYLVGGPRARSADDILAPPSHPFGRDDIGNGQKEGRKGKTEGSPGIERRPREWEGGQRGPFSYRRPFLWRSLRLPPRSLHCFSPEWKRRKRRMSRSPWPNRRRHCQCSGRFSSPSIPLG